MLRHMFTSLAGASYFRVTDVRWLGAINLPRLLLCPATVLPGGISQRKSDSSITRSSVDLLPARHI